MSDEPLRFTVTAADADRLDRVIARRFPGASRRRVMALIEDGGVKILSLIHISEPTRPY